ncbi:ABC transporter substrate-binding protein [Rhodocista pekingensis]|uniref:ABC transporter substrate-binding protein n=1 Tax=Rhodocista pekingensis TaxID=201185 RepID=A0ABW2KVS7_9PROT
MRRALAALVTLLAAWHAHAADGPQRVVSLNLCTDQLAVLLLPPERIAALSHLARDPGLSHVAAEARALPAVQGVAEEILPLRPDIVLAGTYTTRATVALLRARGIPVVELGLASGFDDIRAQTREVARALGVPERGEALLAEMDAKLAAAAPHDSARPTALTLEPGGFTAGGGTLSDAVLAAAGFTNYAAGLGLRGYGYLPVESVAADPPDLLVADRGPEAYPSLADQLLRHPALARSVPPRARPDIPGPLMSCGAPFIADAVVRLAEARRDLLGAGTQVAQTPAAADLP